MNTILVIITSISAMVTNTTQAATVLFKCGNKQTQKIIWNSSTGANIIALGNEQFEVCNVNLIDGRFCPDENKFSLKVESGELCNIYSSAWPKPLRMTCNDRDAIELRQIYVNRTANAFQKSLALQFQSTEGTWAHSNELKLDPAGYCRVW